MSGFSQTDDDTFMVLEGSLKLRIIQSSSEDQRFERLLFSNANTMLIDKKTHCRAQEFNHSTNEFQRGILVGSAGSYTTEAQRKGREKNED